jgi:histone deacetylase 6
MGSVRETPPQSFNWRDVYVCKNSAMSAVLCAGTTVALTEMILHGSVRSAVAIVRPPGHHAEENVCMGFCFFNNVAVAAHAAKARGVKRILILDWDVHHGNATQNMFESDPDVLYVLLSVVL